MALGFVNNCQYFLISCNYLEGTYRKAFLVCKSGHYCHPRWMGSGEGLRDVTAKCHAVKFVPPPSYTHLVCHVSASFTFRFTPIKVALLLSSIYNPFMLVGCASLLLFKIYFCCCCRKFAFFKVSVSLLLACCNVQHQANSLAKSMNPRLTWSASIFPICSFFYPLHCPDN